MAKEKAPVASAAPAEDRKRAIEAAMGQIEKMYGKGSIMRLGDQNNLQVDVIPTGSLSLDRHRRRTERQDRGDLRTGILR